MTIIFLEFDYFPKLIANQNYYFTLDQLGNFLNDNITLTAIKPNCFNRNMKMRK